MRLQPGQRLGTVAYADFCEQGAELVAHGMAAFAQLPGQRFVAGACAQCLQQGTLYAGERLGYGKRLGGAGCDAAGIGPDRGRAGGQAIGKRFGRRRMLERQAGFR